MESGGRKGEYPWEDKALKTAPCIPILGQISTFFQATVWKRRWVRKFTKYRKRRGGQVRPDPWLTPPPFPASCYFPLNSCFAFSGLHWEKQEEAVRWKEKEKGKGNFMFNKLMLILKPLPSKSYQSSFHLQFFLLSGSSTRKAKPTQMSSLRT